MKSTSKLILLFLVSLGANAKSDYPLAMLDRPFTLPKNSFETALQFRNSAVGIMTGDYGITDDLQLGLSWGGMSTASPDLKPDMSMAVNLGYFLFATPYAASMLSLSLPFYFESSVLHSASLALTTSVPLIRGRLAFLLFYNDLVALDWSKNSVQASFNFPVRLNWQATQQLYLKLGTHVATLSTTGTHTNMIDKTPLDLSALFAVTKSVDLLGSFGLKDAQHPIEGGIVVMLGMAIRGGALDG